MSSEYVSACPLMRKILCIRHTALILQEPKDKCVLIGGIERFQCFKYRKIRLFKSAFFGALFPKDIFALIISAKTADLFYLMIPSIALMLRLLETAFLLFV